MIDEEPAKSNLLEHYADVCLEEIIAREARALVKGILYRGDAAISYGESTAGKTFGALDLCWHLALGKPCVHGRPPSRKVVEYRVWHAAFAR